MTTLLNLFRPSKSLTMSCACFPGVSTLTESVYVYQDVIIEARLVAVSIFGRKRRRASAKEMRRFWLRFPSDLANQTVAIGQRLRVA